MKAALLLIALLCFAQTLHAEMAPVAPTTTAPTTGVLPGIYSYPSVPITPLAMPTSCSLQDLSDEDGEGGSEGESEDAESEGSEGDGEALAAFGRGPYLEPNGDLLQTDPCRYADVIRRYIDNLQAQLTSILQNPQTHPILVCENMLRISKLTALIARWRTQQTIADIACAARRAQAQIGNVVQPSGF